MQITIRKLFLAWQFEKEEDWLNEMSSKGFHLVGVGFCKYTFEEGIPGEYAVRLEFLKKYPKHFESVNYIRFLEETGVEHVGSYFRWAYFRKRTQDGGFDLFSDIDSRIKHLNRILLLNIALTPLNVINAFNNFNLYFNAGGFEAALVTGTLCSLLSILMLYGIYNISSKISRLKREQALRE